MIVDYWILLTFYSVWVRYLSFLHLFHLSM